MKDIKITMGAVETFGERIKILEDELRILTKQHNLLQTQVGIATGKNIARKVLQIAGYVIGGIFVLMGLIMTEDSDYWMSSLFLGVLGALFIWAGYYFGKQRNDDTYQLKKKILELNESIEIKNKEIEEYKQKKRELVLENERKLSDSMNDKISEDFSFDDVEDVKECPMCAEIVKAKAKICRYCRHEF